MKTVEIFSGHDFYYQGNNLHDPANACQRTAMIQGLVCSEVPFTFPAEKQPEDYLFELGETPAVQEVKFRDYGQLAYKTDRDGNKTERPTLEIHDLLAKVTNELLVGRPVVRFSVLWDLKDLVFNLVRYRGAAVVSTDIFGGHIITLTGISTHQSDIEDVQTPEDVVSGQIVSVFLNDPNGDFRDGYRSADGKGLELSLENFIRITRREYRWHEKWAHLIRKEGWNSDPIGSKEG